MLLHHASSMRFLDLELTKKQLIDIMLILTRDRVEEKVEKFILKGPYGDIILN